jgi:hypothetical protein
MKVIAKTDNGFLIEAEEAEIKEILNSVNGEGVIKEIKIGQKIPAIDYASSIRKIKSLKDNYHYKNIISSLDAFNAAIENLNSAVENANKIEL